MIPGVIPIYTVLPGETVGLKSFPMAPTVRRAGRGKTPMSRVGKPTKNNSRPGWLNEGGYAYVMVLAAVVVLAILAGTAATLASYEVRHDREEELLFRGLAYERAIQGFYLSHQPGTTPSFPRRLEDLLLDPRFTHQRYLRTLYPDPMGKGW